MIKKTFLVFLSLFFASCQSVSFKREKFSRDRYISYHQKAAQLFIQNFKAAKNPIATEYFTSLVEQLSNKNGVVLTKKKGFEVFLYDGEINFFSLLPNKIFFSRKFLRSIESESLLAIILSYEMVKLSHFIYSRGLFPVLEHRLLEYLKHTNTIAPEQRITLYKWVFYIIKRAGYDIEQLESFIALLLRDDLQKQQKDLRQFRNFSIEQDFFAHGKLFKSSEDFYKFKRSV